MTAPAHTNLVEYSQRRMDQGRRRRPRGTMERSRRCDQLPFSPSSPVSGHCTPNTVSRWKLDKLSRRGSLPPAAIAVHCKVGKHILAVGPDKCPALGERGRKVLMLRSQDEERRRNPMARNGRTGYRSLLPGNTASRTA